MTCSATLRNILSERLAVLTHNLERNERRGVRQTEDFIYLSTFLFALKWNRVCAEQMRRHRRAAAQKSF